MDSRFGTRRSAIERTNDPRWAVKQGSSRSPFEWICTTTLPLRCAVRLLINVGQTALTSDPLPIQRVASRFLSKRRKTNPAHSFPFSRECYLRDIKMRGRAELENRLTSIARVKPAKTPCSVLSIDVPFPKLDVVDWRFRGRFSV